MRTLVGSVVDLGAALVSVVYLGPLQQSWRVMVMKLGADRTVNGPGLEARVRIAEGYRGGHIANVMETMLKRWISGEGLSLTA